ncbi:hypothetical protein WEI85_35970 [Actinomycetes bacterium KLBMP 9797]
MNAFLDTSLIALLVLLLWPLARALVFVGAAAVALLSRNRTRRAEARRMLRMILSRQPNDPQP